MIFDYYGLIGNIVVSFQSLEFSMKTMIAELTGMDEEVSLTITAEMSFSNVLNLLKDLASIKFKDNVEVNNKINELIAEVKIILQKKKRCYPFLLF